MSADIQDKIAAARREAEGLKEKIKRKKDELADADCKFTFQQALNYSLLRRPVLLLFMFPREVNDRLTSFRSEAGREGESRASTAHWHENSEGSEGPSCENIRNALVD